MAYAFSPAMGLDGQIGTITMELADGKTVVTEGHRSPRGGARVGRKSRAAAIHSDAAGPANDDFSIRSG